MAIGRVSRLGAACAVFAAVCAVMNLASMALAVDFDVARLWALRSLIDVDERAERLLVLAMWIDAAFYLSLVPLSFVLAPDGGTAGQGVADDAGRVAGSVYALLGAAGALALALKWPVVFDRYDNGDASAAAAFSSLTDFVMRRVWNFACAALGAVWWIAVARAWRAHRWFAIASWALAGCSIVEGATSIAQAYRVADLVLAPLLGLLPLWCLLAARALVRPAYSARP